MYRRPFRFLQLLGATALVVAVTAATLLAQDDAAQTDLGPPTATTEVLGQPPIDLRGLWLVVSHGKIAQERIRNVVELYQVEGEGENLKIELTMRQLPDSWKQALETANRQFEEWNPTPEQVAELARTVDRLEPQDPNRYLRHTVKLVAPDHYADAQLDAGPIPVDGSVVAIKAQHAYRPRPAGDNEAQLMSDDALFIVTKAEPTRLQGDHARMLLAAGFLPIPVKLQGPFVMYRLRGPGEALPSAGGGGGWLASLWDTLTRGCR